MDTSKFIVVPDLPLKPSKAEKIKQKLRRKGSNRASVESSRNASGKKPKQLATAEIQQDERRYFTA
jgi:hypothetical protein